MKRFGLKLYSKIISIKKQLDMELVNYKVKNNPNIFIAENSVVYPEANVVSHFNRGGIKIGERTYIRGEVQCLRENGKVEIGEECYIGKDTHIWSSCNITIGDRVLIAHNCNIFDNTTHPIDATERNDDFTNICINGKWKTYDTYYSAPVHIGDDVWIGCNSIILKGVTIGEGAIIGAGSVVTHNVEPYTMVAGNPARQVKRIETNRKK